MEKLVRGLKGEAMESHLGMTRRYLRRGYRLVLHYLPTYAPEANPIECVWWHLHEQITRGHRC